MNADNDVLYGIRTVASLLQDGHLLISDHCQGLIKEIPGYAWSPKATEKGLDQLRSRRTTTVVTLYAIQFPHRKPCGAHTLTHR